MKIIPFLKWAGGKRWLLSNAQLAQPQKYDRYIEPFLGGGAVFFQIAPRNSIISDINSDLIEFYRVLRDSPSKLSEEMARHQRLHCVEYYYEQRKYVPRSALERASRFLYLNRTCWNGLYRVNAKGEFNVPIGTKNTVILKTDDYWGASCILNNSVIENLDFESIIDRSSAGDFVFVDPPYTVKHNYNNFIKYNEKLFSWSDQIRLKESVVRAASRGACLVICNADHKSVHELYGDVGRYLKLSRASVLSGKSAGRRETTEAMYCVNF
ncbi:MAG: DNA adenine methylase [Thermodesulfobacteriota bacterium]